MPDTTARRPVQCGDREMSYTMQPCGPDGHPINHGNHYANAHTIGDARTWAAEILAKPGRRHLGHLVATVTIDGGLYEFTGGAWSHVRGEPGVHEVVHPQQLPSDAQTTTPPEN